MEQYQQHNSIDPSLPHPHPPFFSTTAASAVPPINSQPPPPTAFSPPQSQLPNQITYDEMILAAIAGLGEKDGSSRQAIARYIERVYSNLPSNHSILLTNHLKTLKNCGQLIMVKRSYLLPSGSTPSPAYTFPPPSTGVSNPLYTTSTAVPPFSPAAADGSAAGATPQLKKRGRPPKAKVDVAQVYSAQNVAADGLTGLDQAQYQNYVDGPNGPVQSGSHGPNGNVGNGPGSVKRRPGRPRKDKTNQAQTQAQSEAQYTFSTGLGETQNISFPQGGAPVEDNGSGGGGASHTVVQGSGVVSESEAMLVSLGLSDGPVPAKMRPRRAPKPTTAAQPQPEEHTSRKKRPGRPRKVAPPAPGVWPVQVPVGAVVGGSGLGRGRGRPRKDQLAVVLDNGGVDGVQVQHKKRGRKPKSTTQDAGFSVPVSFMMPEQMNGGGGAMMPQAPYTQAGGAAAVAAAAGGFVQGNVPVSVSDGYNGVVHSVPAKRGRGRPPGVYGSYGQRKARKLSGKPLGRPRKNSAGSEDQSFDIVNLKNKIDYLQSKISEALPVIKSGFINEEPNVMGALGQLEELAKMDFTAPAAPANVQNQQQPHAQPLQAEHQ